jgi:hypothetical protein
MQQPCDQIPSQMFIHNKVLAHNLPVTSAHVGVHVNDDLKMIEYNKSYRFFCVHSIKVVQKSDRLLDGSKAVVNGN